VNTFQIVIEDLGPALARIAASYERNAALREELLQEIRMAVFSALPRLRDAAKRKTFVLRIAHNCCVDHVVKHAAIPITEDIPEDFRSDDSTPEDQLLEQENSHLLVEAVRRLELPYRQVMTLLLEDLSYVEIADTLGISLVNVGVRVNRAKAQLKEFMTHVR
jgi:RNA polymerase sigma factor (sigma-70 family)